MYVFYFYTVELIFCFKVKTKKVVAWELFYCVLHFLFFLYNILVFFFHLRIENKNQFRDILLHKTLCSNPLFWSSILINVSVRVCGLHSCVVCRELGWRHLVSLHPLEHQGIQGEGVQTEERTAAAPEGCTESEYRFCFCPRCSDPCPGEGKRELSSAQPANAITKSTTGNLGFSLQAGGILTPHLPISQFTAKLVNHSDSAGDKRGQKGHLYQVTHASCLVELRAWRALFY